MTTNELDWLLQSRELWRDQNPGCHTHASGFDYVAFECDCDAEIDFYWLQEARKILLRKLANRIIE